MLDFGPERVGHAVAMSGSVRGRLLKEGVRVEVCVTSNMWTRLVSGVGEHPVVTEWIPGGVKFCVCTDDSGILGTSLTREYRLIVECLGIKRGEVAEIAMRGLSLGFSEEGVKGRVWETFYARLQALCESADEEECDIVRTLKEQKEG